MESEIIIITCPLAADLTDHAILCHFVYMFLEWVGVHCLYLTLLIGWAVSEARLLFFVNPSLFFWPCIHCVYFRHVLRAFNTIAFTYKKNWKWIRNGSILASHFQF